MGAWSWSMSEAVPSTVDVNPADAGSGARRNLQRRLSVPVGPLARGPRPGIDPPPVEGQLQHGVTVAELLPEPVEPGGAVATDPVHGVQVQHVADHGRRLTGLMADQALRVNNQAA